jgi:hypothetical protein
MLSWRGPVTGRGSLKQKPLLALALFALLCGGAKAQDASGEPVFRAEQLKAACSPAANAADAKLCDSYLRGLADGLFMLGALDTSRMRVCLPKDGPMAVADAKAAFLKYAAQHPDMLTHSAALAGTSALVAANPCADEARDGRQE